MGRQRSIVRASAFGICVVLVASACTSDDSSANGNGVVSTAVVETSTTETVELLPYDEQNEADSDQVSDEDVTRETVPPGPDADDEAIDDLGATDPDGTPATTESANTESADTENTIGSIVPPGEDSEDNGEQPESTTTAPPTTVSPDAPVNGDVEQPLQAESAALACATVELGYLQQLSGKNGSERLSQGAAMAIATGVGKYVTAGQNLADAVDAGSGIDGAADALLSQCETDGFERLA